MVLANPPEDVLVNTTGVAVVGAFGAKVNEATGGGGFTSTRRTTKADPEAFDTVSRTS